jgi:allantoinase
MSETPLESAKLGGPPDLIVSASRVVTPTGIRSADVHIRDGVITAVTAAADRTAIPRGPRSAGQHSTAARVSPPGQGLTSGSSPNHIRLADDEVLMPGLVDTHVHVNEPGRTDWEGFATATAAAAAGGVTTIIDMPLNSVPPTTDVAALGAKRATAAGQCAVDVGFWGGAVPANTADRPALRDAGVCGFKCFMVDSGVPEFPPLDDAGLAAAMRQVAELGSLLIVHAEDAASIAAAPAPSGRGYSGFLRSRPPAAEVAAIVRVLRLAAATGARVHVLHLSSADPVPLLTAARASGTRVTAETCPHYLTLAAEQVGPGRTEFKCCPPIREVANRERLWAGLESGAIDCVVSDHSPCPPELKDPRNGDFGTAWGGISSIQLGLPVVWTHARERGFSPADVARWMSSSPARLAGLATTKGAIAPGHDADLVAFAPDEDFVVEPERLLTRHKLTPYAGAELTGAVRRSWLRGVPVTRARPTGRLLVPNLNPATSARTLNP